MKLIEIIKRAAAEHFDVPLEAMTSNRRARAWAFPRQVAMYLCCRLVPHATLPRVGDLFGGRDHTTVMHAIKAVTKRRARDPEYDKSIARLEADLRAKIPRRHSAASESADAEYLARAIGREVTVELLRIARRHPGPFLRRFLLGAGAVAVTAPTPQPVVAPRPQPSKVAPPVWRDPWPAHVRFDRPVPPRRDGREHRGFAR